MSTAKGSYGMRNTAIDLDRMSDVIARSCGVPVEHREVPKRPKKMLSWVHLCNHRNGCFAQVLVAPSGACYRH
jgi:hypothetical protein